MGATGRCRRLSERQGGMDYRSVLRCPAQCVRRRWLPLHAGVDSAPKTLSDDLCRHASSRSLPHRSEEHTSELQSPDHLVCRLLLEKKKTKRESLSLYLYRQNP